MTLKSEIKIVVKTGALNYTTFRKKYNLFSSKISFAKIFNN